MSSITRYIIGGRDSVFTSDTSFYAGSEFHSTGKSGSDIRNSALIFRNITIPKASVINSAYIYMAALVNQASTGIKTRFSGIKTTNPKGITNYNDFIGRPLTTNAVDWDFDTAWVQGTYYQSPDLKTIIQEIVDSGDWGYGCSMGFMWKDDGSDTDSRRSPAGWNAFAGESQQGLKTTYITIDFTPSTTSVSQTIRISLPGYNALTDTNIDHFILFADSGQVLIKEFLRGSLDILANDQGYVNHALGYIPFAVVYIDDGSDFYFVSGVKGSKDFELQIDTNNLEIWNDSGSTITAKYYIFYDQMI